MTLQIITNNIIIRTHKLSVSIKPPPYGEGGGRGFNMKTWKKATIGGVAALVFIGTFSFLYKKSQPEETLYETHEAKVMDLEKTTLITGRIEPRDEVNIKPQISGIITELLKEAGQMVSKDEVIAKIKVIPDMSNLSSAENRVNLAEINMKQAETDFNRAKALHDKKMISAEEYEKSEVALKQARAELMTSRDALNIVRKGISLSNANMSTTLIRSTIDGLILDIPVKVGNNVILSNNFNDGTTIATVADMNKLIFRGNVDETEVGRIHEGMPVTITIGALENVKMNAILEYISPKATENNGAKQFEIKAAVSVPKDVAIRSGYSANAGIVLQKATKALTVPEAAIEFSGDSTFVYVLTDSVPKQMFRRQQVTVGMSDGINIEVKSGLKRKDIVRGIAKGALGVNNE